MRIQKYNYFSFRHTSANHSSMNESNPLMHSQQLYLYETSNAGYTIVIDTHLRYFTFKLVHFYSEMITFFGNSFWIYLSSFFFRCGFVLWSSIKMISLRSDDLTEWRTLQIVLVNVDQASLWKTMMMLTSNPFSEYVLILIFCSSFVSSKVWHPLARRSGTIRWTDI